MRKNLQNWKFRIKSKTSRSNLKLLTIIQMKFKIIIYAIKTRFKESKSLRLKSPGSLNRERKTTRISLRWPRFRNSRLWNCPRRALRKRNWLNKSQKCRYWRTVKTMLHLIQAMKSLWNLRNRHIRPNNHLQCLLWMRRLMNLMSLLTTYLSCRKIWHGSIFKSMIHLLLRKMIVMK